ncbi:MAG: hypothetical protein GTO00_09145 [Deltaproteobacteria bacterium]|nr:hypothetical protein [Deltaproteobacteria bacterium]
MSGANLEFGSSRSVMMEQVLFRPQIRTLAGNVTLVVKSPTLQVMDPGGAARTVTLPAEADSEGLMFIVANTADAAEIITIQDDGLNAIATPTQNETAIVVCDGVNWHGLVGADA